MAALSAQGHQLSVLVRPRSTAGFRPPPGTEVVAGDLLATTSLRRLVDRADAVVHVAAVYRTAGHPDRYYWDVNVEGTRRLLEAAMYARVTTFVHTSTVGVLGHIEQPPADESSTLSPGDVYQQTKAEGERVALDYGNGRGMKVVVLRPAAIYGPGDTRHLKLFRAIARGRYCIVGSGEALHHLVFIDDLVRAYERALSAETSGEVFIVAGPEYTTQAALAQEIAKATGGRVLPWRVPPAPLLWAAKWTERVCVPLGVNPPLHRRRVQFWSRNRAFSTAKAEKLLGWKPAVPLLEGIARTVSAYREKGLL